MRLIVADDAALLREGVIGLLERQGHQILGQATSAPELEILVDRSMTAGNPPEVILTDVRMPPSMTTDGLDAAVRIRAKYPGLGILLLSQYVAPAYAAELFHHPATDNPRQASASGGLGYLLKERIARITDFLDSLQVIARGGVVIDPDVASLLVTNRPRPLDSLTPREREVLKLMARGLSNPQISEHLTLSAGAVSKHVANIFTKLQLPSTEENRRVRAVLAYLTTQDEPQSRT